MAGQNAVAQQRGDGAVPCTHAHCAFRVRQSGANYSLIFMLMFKDKPQ
jgi:hypothetical protein